MRLTREGGDTLRGCKCEEHQDTDMVSRTSRKTVMNFKGGGERNLTAEKPARWGHLKASRHQ